MTARMADNPHVPMSKIQYYRDKYGEDSPIYRVRVMGSIEVVTGVVYEGIEKCLVSNDYIPEEYRGLSKSALDSRFIWAEAQDYGISKKDPTMVIFCKIWDNVNVCIQGFF